VLFKVSSSLSIELSPAFLERTHLRSIDVGHFAVILEDEGEVLDDSSEYQIGEEVWRGERTKESSAVKWESYEVGRSIDSHIDRTFQMMKRA